MLVSAKLNPQSHPPPITLRAIYHSIPDLAIPNLLNTTYATTALNHKVACKEASPVRPRLDMLHMLPVAILHNMTEVPTHHRIIQRLV